MPRTVINDKPKKLNFFIPGHLAKKIETVRKINNLSMSELARNALSEYTEKLEKERIKQAMIEECERYYDIDRHIAKEWRSAEAEI